MHYYRDIKLLVSKGVYPPSEDSHLLAETVEPVGKVLEVGTGSGIIAIQDRRSRAATVGAGTRRAGSARTDSRSDNKRGLR